jgi:hypothetical protein
VRKKYPPAVTQARADLDEARRWLASHLQQCPSCRAAVPLAAWTRTCDTGWALIKWKHRQAAALDKALGHNQALTSAQERLF